MNDMFDDVPGLVWIGGYDTDWFTSDSENSDYQDDEYVVWISLTEDVGSNTAWKLDLTSVELSSGDLDDDTTDRTAELRSGFPFISMPFNDFYTIYDEITDTNSCSEWSECSSHA